MRSRGRWLVAVGAAVAVACAGAFAGAAPDVASAASSTAMPDASALAGTPEELARERTAAWIVPWDRANVLASLRANQRRIGRISPFWFYLRADGAKVLGRPGVFDADVLQIARDNGMSVVPTIGNEFDAKRLARMLRTPATRARHVAQLVALADRDEFDGIDLDYENLAVADRARFTAFVEALATELHARGLTLSVTVMSATGPRSGSIGAAATDYAAIGAVADEVRVMAYDFHWACGAAGAVAPIEWVEAVAAYVATQVPPEKVLLGVPLYGYDWPVRGGCATARTWRETNLLRTVWKGLAAFSTTWQANRLTYRPGVRRAARVVWFEDAAATAAKAAVAREYGLGGVALWRLGGEDPATWAALRDELGVAEDPAADAGAGSTAPG